MIPSYEKQKALHSFGVTGLNAATLIKNRLHAVKSITKLIQTRRDIKLNPQIIWATLLVVCRLLPPNHLIHTKKLLLQEPSSFRLRFPSARVFLFFKWDVVCVQLSVYNVQTCILLPHWWCRSQNNNILSYYMPVVFTLFACFFFSSFHSLRRGCASVLLLWSCALLASLVLDLLRTAQRRRWRRLFTTSQSYILLLIAISLALFALLQQGEFCSAFTDA